MKHIKHKIASFMRKKMENTWVYSVLVKMNLVIFHFEKKEHTKRFGNRNPDKTFYVIRGCGKEAGLFALYIDVMNEVYMCNKKGWIPIVDFNDNRTQYNEKVPVRGNVWNAWEYYFEQPINKWTLEEVYQSKNVILSGWKLLDKKEKEFIWDGEKLIDTNEISRVKNFISQYGKMQLEVIEKIKEEKNRIFCGKKHILGISVRGTDYLAFKPKGHYIQPPLQDVIMKTKEMLSVHAEIDGIFLTTEDENIYKEFKKEFGEIILTSNSNRISDYSGKSYITTELRNNSKYEQGLEYLIEKTLLTECEYLVATRTAGSDFALVLNGNVYKEKYIFNLGKY